MNFESPVNAFEEEKSDSEGLNTTARKIQPIKLIFDKQSQPLLNFQLEKKKMKMTKDAFIKKIGGWKKFKDFLENKKQLYLPPPNDFTAEFGLAILQKTKKAFKYNQVKFVHGVPQESEFSIAVVMEMVKNDVEVKLHLPNYSKTHRPDKKFILNIVNTVHEDSIMNWVKEVKKLKLEEKQKQKKDYIEIDEDLFNEIEAFESLYDADKDKKNRLAGMMMESRKKVKT